MNTFTPDDWQHYYENPWQLRDLSNSDINQLYNSLPSMAFLPTRKAKLKAVSKEQYALKGFINQELRRRAKGWD